MELWWDPWGNDIHHCLGDELRRQMEWTRRTAKLTVGDVLKDEALIKASGINPWCVNEGLATMSEPYNMPLTIAPPDWHP
jgi:hypothetical protein